MDDLSKQLLGKMKQLEDRIAALEGFNQAATLKFGNITLDSANGRIVVKDGSGVNRTLIDSTGLKTSRSGYDVTTTANVNLSFNSNYSMFREVQMQINPDHEFTNSNTNVDLYDAQIQLNFADWPDNNMYYETVMKTGTGTAYVSMYNQTTSATLVTVTTTAIVATSIRSGAITKPTGVNSFREQYRNSDGGSSYTDLYIGRVIMRYDF